MHTFLSAFNLAVTIILLFPVQAKEFLIRAVYNHNGISQDFKAMGSNFGPVLHHEGLLGYLVEARPANACDPLQVPPPSNDSVVAFIVLIQRQDCSFTTKVLHAQRAGYHAAIIHNVNSDALVTMLSENEATGQEPVIPSLFVSESTSAQLKRIFHYDPTAYVILIPECHCSDIVGYSCPVRPQKLSRGTPKENFRCVPAQCHFVHEVHYLLFGLLLTIWIVALYALCFW